MSLNACIMQKETARRIYGYLISSELCCDITLKPLKTQMRILQHTLKIMSAGALLTNLELY